MRRAQYAPSIALVTAVSVLYSIVALIALLYQEPRYYRGARLAPSVLWPCTLVAGLTSLAAGLLYYYTHQAEARECSQYTRACQATRNGNLTASILFWGNLGICISSILALVQVFAVYIALVIAASGAPVWLVCYIFAGQAYPALPRIPPHVLAKT